MPTTAVTTDLVDRRRVRRLNGRPFKDGAIIYWMSRDQRVEDNWALLYAQDLARREQRPLAVVFALAPSFLGATRRQYAFMLKGLMEVEARLLTLGLPFFMLTGQPEKEVAKFANDVKAGAVVTDFSPLTPHRVWRSANARRLQMALFEVDTHNIVPCWVTSTKQDYSAGTFRPRLHAQLADYLTDIPEAAEQMFIWDGPTANNDWLAISNGLRLDETVAEVDWCQPGEAAAQAALNDFLRHGLKDYGERNDPNAEAQSGLSPYLHFGQLAPQRVAWEARRHAHAASSETLAEFLDELIVRRELADNLCYFSHGKYDTTEIFADWAKETIRRHAKDARPHRYTLDRLERAKTHDDLWNAAQLEMVHRGTMPGYLRMYWAKKILEWSPSAAEAQRRAIFLNDKYQLDGRDPNGYAGIAWSIGGVHDRAWPERPIFGQIRFMSHGGSESKFDVKRYIQSQQN